MTDILNAELDVENTAEAVAAEVPEVEMPAAEAEANETPIAETAEAPVAETAEAPVAETAEAPVAETAKAPAEATPAVETAEAPVEKISSTETTESMEDYSKELNSSLRKIYEGDIMEGEVIAFNEHGVILDLSYFATGRVPVEEMSADPSFNIMTDVKIGDRFQAVVKSVDDGKGNILLSKKACESENSWDKLRQMKEEETVVTGTVTETVKAGAIMYVEGIRGFIPASRLDVRYVEDTAPFLGKKLQVKITEVDEERRKLILSAKEIATQAYMEEQAEKVGKLDIGSIVEGTVESLQNYGAFVDLGNGISGLIHISEISSERISHPKVVLRTGQKVTVMIIRIKDGKVSLSMKAVEAAKEEKVEEEAREYRSEYVPNNPFADLLKDYINK